MPPVLGPRVAVEGALVVLRRGERHRGGCRRTARRSSPPRRRGTPRSRCPAAARLPENIASIAASASATVAATTTPLPAASPSALTTMGAPCAAHIGLGRGGIGEAPVGGGRNAVRPAEVLGEALRAFEPRRRPGRAEGLDAGGLEIIDDAGAQAAPRARPPRSRPCRPCRRRSPRHGRRGRARRAPPRCAMPALPGAQ